MTMVLSIHVNNRIIGASCCFLSQSLSKSKNKFTRSMGSSGVLMNPDLDGPASFPDWAYEPRDFFRYELIYQSKKSNARVGDAES